MFRIRESIGGSARSLLGADIASEATAVFGVFGVYQLIELQKSALPLLALVLAGLVGLTGLLASYFASGQTSPRHIEGQISCLIVGIVSALVLAGYLVMTLQPEFGPSPARFFMTLLFGPIEFVVLAVEGCKAIGRLTKARLEADGRTGSVPSVDSLMLATTVLSFNRAGVQRA